MFGKCKLCGRDGVELKKSHYIPAAAYRALRDEIPGINPNPYHLSNGQSIQSSYQDRAHLLCADCEQRFSKGGENWFFRHSLQKGGSFRLLDILRSGQPSISGGPELDLYEASNFPTIKWEDLVYFATSVFWRGSIHAWNSDGSVPVNLHSYADEFRRYLLGEKGFPQRAVLQVYIRPPGSVSRVTYGPVGLSRYGHSRYRFAIPGFLFTLLIGPNLTVRDKEYCFVRGLGHPLIVTTMTDQKILKETRKSMGFDD